MVCGSGSRSALRRLGYCPPRWRRRRLHDKQPVRDGFTRSFQSKLPRRGRPQAPSQEPYGGAPDQARSKVAANTHHPAHTGRDRRNGSLIEDSIDELHHRRQWRGSQETHGLVEAGTACDLRVVDEPTCQLGRRGDRHHRRTARCCHSVTLLATDGHIQHVRRTPDEKRSDPPVRERHANLGMRPLAGRGAKLRSGR